MSGTFTPAPESLPLAYDPGAATPQQPLMLHLRSKNARGVPYATTSADSISRM